MKLKNARILLTGATGGLGHELANQLSAAGASLLLAGRAETRLNEMRAAIARNVEGLGRSFDDIVDAATDVATDDEHDPEGHTIAWERQQVAALLHEATLALAAIDAAEQRLDAGLYGTCADCGLGIADERLDALPATPVCIHCAR